MEFLNSKKFIIIMLIVLVWAGLSGCTSNHYLSKKPPHETEKEMNANITKDMEAMDKEQADKDHPGQTNFVGIAEALGCVFAPDKCVPAERKAEQKMDR